MVYGLASVYSEQLAFSWFSPLRINFSYRATALGQRNAKAILSGSDFGVNISGRVCRQTSPPGQPNFQRPAQFAPGLPLLLRSRFGTIMSVDMMSIPFVWPNPNGLRPRFLRHDSRLYLYESKRALSALGRHNAAALSAFTIINKSQQKSFTSY